MDGDECEFSDPELSRSHRGSVASSVSRTQDVLVYLVGDSAVHLCVEGVVSVCVQELGRLVRQPLNITDCDQDAFAFWLCSPLLELQLKPKHQPYKLCRQWQDLLYRFTDASTEDISVDEPCLQYKRNVFYPKAKELQVEDEGVLKLLYEEARLNILENRYPCDPEHWIRLGALSCAIEFGSGLDDYKLIVAVREKKLTSFLPAHVVLGPGGFFSSLRARGSRQGELEQRLLKEYRTLSSTQGSAALFRQYLSTCHKLPYYGRLTCDFQSFKSPFCLSLPLSCSISLSGGRGFMLVEAGCLISPDSDQLGQAGAGCHGEGRTHCSPASAVTVRKSRLLHFKIPLKRSF
uniref:FERM domain-containing protein 8 n=1 Tax=Astyanax mexicanus TaxID=7994 RepID=A0A8B9R6V7_ASTMX